VRANATVFASFKSVTGVCVIRKLGLLPIMVVVLLASLVIAFVVSLALAWLDVRADLNNSASRALQNAERLIDRTAADLQKLDGLRAGECDAAAVERLKDAVYNASTQVREAGLVRNSQLFCTNFGPVSVDLRTSSTLLQPGIHVDVGPNAVVPNNTSLFVYASRAPDSAVNAVINPQVFAEYERDFHYAANARMELVYRGKVLAPGNAPRDERIYELGSTKFDANADAFTTVADSKRFPLRVNISAGRSALGDAFREIAPVLFAASAALAVIGSLLLHRWIDSGGLNRSRYEIALRRRELVIYYQPIVSAKDRHIVGFEALLRWNHPRLGLLSAGQFSEMFADDAFAEPLTRYVISTVAKDLLQMKQLRPDIWCSVNVAPPLLDRTGVMSEITFQLERLAKQHLRIELTERTPVSDASANVIREMRAQGLLVGVDDLGTGYSNLGQLQKLAFDFIKIDGLLVNSIQSADGVSPVVETLIALALKLDVEVIAEGVETPIQAQALAKRGVHQLQGYLFGPGKSLQDSIVLLKKANTTTASVRAAD
jgi:sensor c-di-GMP phosphodiesterase-like protein